MCLRNRFSADSLRVSLMGILGRPFTALDGTLTLTDPAGNTITRQGGHRQYLYGFGDLYPTVTLRWNHGVHNFMVYGTGDIPVGTYDPDAPRQSRHRPRRLDGGFGYTYFNPATGHEFSAVTGVTYNFKNTDTTTRTASTGISTGARRSFSRSRSIGVVGYFYQQLTADRASRPSSAISSRACSASARRSASSFRSATCRAIST